MADVLEGEVEVSGVMAIGLEMFLFGDGFLFWGADVSDAVAGLDVSGAEGFEGFFVFDEVWAVVLAHLGGFVGADLEDFASAAVVPGGEVVSPEGVVCREGEFVEGGVCFSDAAIADGFVLPVWELFEFCGVCDVAVSGDGDGFCGFGGDDAFCGGGGGLFSEDGFEFFGDGGFCFGPGFGSASDGGDGVADGFDFLEVAEVGDGEGACAEFRQQFFHCGEVDSRPAEGGFCCLCVWPDLEGGVHFLLHSPRLFRKR